MRLLILSQTSRMNSMISTLEMSLGDLISIARETKVKTTKKQPKTIGTTSIKNASVQQRKILAEQRVSYYEIIHIIHRIWG